MIQLGLYEAPRGRLVLDASPFADDVTITTNEHGFERLTTSTDLRLEDAFGLYDAPIVLFTALTDRVGFRLWEGRREDPSLIAGQQSGAGIQALGAWRAFSDDRYTALWSTTSVAEFVETTGAMVATYDESERWQRDTNNRLFIALVKNNAYTLNKAGGLAWSIPHLSTRQIVGIQFELTANLSGNFTFRCNTLDGDISGALSAGVIAASFTGLGSVQTRAYHLVLGTPKDTVIFDIQAAAAVTYAGETAANYARVTKLRIVSATTNRVDTTLTANRAAGAGVTATVGSTARMYAGMQLVINSGANPSEIVTVQSIASSTQFVATFVGSYLSGDAVQGFVVYADEITEDLIAQAAALNSSQVSSSTALVQSPGLDLLDETFEDSVPAEILTTLAAKGDTLNRQWEVGAWEGQTLHFRPRGEAARAWYVDAIRFEVERSLQDLANVVYVTYEDANSRALRTADNTNSESVNRYGITRRAVTDATTTSATQAGIERDTFLVEHADPLPRAGIEFEAIYDASGARYPLYMMRAGDMITVRNLPPALGAGVDRIRTFRITHTEYQSRSDTITVETELPLPTTRSTIVRATRRESV